MSSVHAGRREYEFAVALAGQSTNKTNAMKPPGKKTIQTFAMLLAPAAFVLLGVRAASAQNYPATILSNNPSAYYRFEELPSATTAVDSSANGVNATYVYNLANTSPQLGLPGIDTNSIGFNGTDPVNSDFGYVDIPASTLISPVGTGTNSAAFSAELWVEVPSQPATWTVPLEVAQYPNGWNIYVSGADAGNGAASWFYLSMRPSLFTSVVQIQFHQWNHLVVTYDGTNTAYMYVNGVQYGPYNASGWVPAIGSDAHVGSAQGSGWKPLNGDVDEVAFYTNVLTLAQVQNHYQVGTNSFRVVPTAPSIASGGNPASTTNYSGLPASFTVNANGTTPLTYQWLENSVPVGSNSSLLSFICHYPADNNASIQVVITNNYGSITSTVATLTVSTNLNILSPPPGITRNVGSYAAFHVTANGAVPITYQWQVSVNGGATFAPIGGATNQTFWLSNVQSGMSGYQYQAVVTGPFTTSTAGPAALTVQARPVNVPLTGYGALVAAASPVAYWRLDETNGSTTAVDAVGSFDGAYTPNAGTISYGVLPVGIPGDTDPAITLAAGSTIQIPFAPELNPDIPWSVESWIQPSSLSANGGDYRVVLSSEYNLYPNPYNGWFIYQQPANSLIFVTQPGNAFIVAAPDDPANSNQLVAGKWYYIVVTDDGTNFNFYINGELRTSYPVASSGFIPNGDGINLDGTAGITSGLGNTVVGQRTDGAFNTFLGTVDDTAIYNYPLNQQQITSHFLNQVSLTIARSGNNVIVNWPAGTGTLQSSTAVDGPYTSINSATPPYTAAVSGTATFYRLLRQ